MKEYVEQEQQNSVFVWQQYCTFFLLAFFFVIVTGIFIQSWLFRSMLFAVCFYGKRHINQIITTSTIELCYDVEFMWLDLQQTFVEWEFLCAYNGNLSFLNIYCSFLMNTIVHIRRGDSFRILTFLLVFHYIPNWSHIIPLMILHI